MAGKTPSGNITTRIGIEGLEGTVQSLKSLRSTVNSLTSEWRAQEAQLKSAGDYTSAAEAKYKGLGKAVDEQRSYLERLKNEQASVDASTDRGAQQFAKLGRDVANATTRLASMESQQNRAKDTMNYYKSGIASAQTELKKMSDVSASYVNRLQAEGKTQEANKRQLSDLRAQYSKMSELYTKQSAELSRIASESGKTSDAYQKQVVRLNETATSMGKAKTQMTGLNREIKDTKYEPFKKLASAVTGVNKQTEKGSGLLKKFVAGGVISNAITTGWSDLASGISSAVKSGLALNEAGEKSAATWSAMGKSAAGIRSLSAQVSELTVKSGQSIVTIGTMQKTVDTMTHGNTVATQAVTAGLTAIGTASRLSGDGMERLTKSMTRVVASGSLTSTTLARMEKSAPALGAELARAAGVSQDAFAKMVASGKVSSQDFLNLVARAGRNGSEVYKEFGKTAEGAQAQTAAGWNNLKKSMTGPLYNVKTSGMTELASILNSPVMQDAARSLGNAIARIGEGAENVLTYIGKHKSDVTGISKDMFTIAKIAGETVWAVFKTFLGDIANAFGVGGKNAKAMKDPLGSIHDILDKIVANKSGIQTVVKTILALFAVKKAVQFASAIGSVYSNLRQLPGLSAGIDKLSASWSRMTGATSASPSMSVAPKAAAEGAEVSTTSRAASTLGKVGNVAGKAGGIFAGIDVAGSLVSALVSNNTQTKVKAAAKTTGAAAGAGIGAALGSIIPGAGTLAGAGIGAGIGDMLGSSKTAQKWGNSIRKSMAKASAGLKISASKISFDSKSLGNSMSKYTKSLSKKMVVSMSTDPASLRKSQASVQSTYAKMSKSVDDYYKRKENTTAADLKKFVKNGDMTKSQADKQLAKLKKSDAEQAKSKKSAYATMAKDANSYYNQAEKIANGSTTKLESIAKKYGKNSTKYQKEQNKEMLAAYKSYANTYARQEMSNNSKITSTVKRGADQQEKLLKKLTKDKGTLSYQQLVNTQKNARKEYQAAVKPAQQARDQIIKAANQRYKSTKNAAEHEYKDLHTISKSQYDTIVHNSRKQRDDVTDAANDQYKKVTKHATNQYHSTKDAITKQKIDAIKMQEAQRTDVSAYATAQSKSVVGHAQKQANSSLKASHHQASGTGNIFSGLASWFNKIVGALGGSKVSTGKGSYNYSTISGLAYAGGGTAKGGKALVGEAGPELRYSPYSGHVDILGSKGAEFASVNSGDYILNASDTAKLMSGSFTGRLPGYAGGTSSLAEFLKKVKSGASSIFDHVSDAATKLIDGIKDPMKTLENLAEKIFNINSVSGVGSVERSISKGMRNRDIKSLANLFSKLKKSFDENTADGGGQHGNPGGSGVSRWRSLVEKALAANHLSTSLVGKVLRQIATESGGNPAAHQPGADPDGDGSGPALGLMQTKRGTFNANAFPGHHDIFNGYDNILAGLHYAKARYGSSLYFLGQGHGYANGGFADSPSIFGESGLEAAIPLSAVKSSRGYELLGKTAAAMAARDNVNESATGDRTTLADVVDQIKTLTGTMEHMAFAMNVYLDGDAMAQKQAPKIKAITDQQTRFNNYWTRKGVART